MNRRHVRFLWPTCVGHQRCSDEHPEPKETWEFERVADEMARVRFLYLSAAAPRVGTLFLATS